MMIQKETLKFFSILLIATLSFQQVVYTLPLDKNDIISFDHRSDVQDQSYRSLTMAAFLGIVFLVSGTIGVVLYAFNPIEYFTCESAANTFLYSGAMGVAYASVALLLPFLGGTVAAVGQYLQSALQMINFADHATLGGITTALSEYINQYFDIGQFICENAYNSRSFWILSSGQDPALLDLHENIRDRLSQFFEEIAGAVEVYTDEIPHDPMIEIISPSDFDVIYSDSILVAADVRGIDPNDIEYVEFQYSQTHEDGDWHPLPGLLSVDGKDYYSPNGWYLVFSTGPAFANIVYDETVWVRARVVDVGGIVYEWDESDQSFAVDNTLFKPMLLIDPVFVDFGTMVQGSYATEHVIISNQNGGMLTWQASPSHSWISLSNSSGLVGPEGSFAVGVTMNTTDLEQGQTYQGSIYISSNGGDETVSVLVGVGELIVLPTIQPGPSDGRDAYISSLNINMNYGDSIEIELMNFLSHEKYGLIQFNLDALADHIIIQEATMNLFASYVIEPDPNIVKVFSVGYPDWDELDITWDAALNNPFILRPVETVASVTKNQWTSFDITNLVTKWYNEDRGVIGPSDVNRGMVLRMDPQSNDNHIKFYTSDFSTNSNLHPYLKVTYSELQPDFGMGTEPSIYQVEEPGGTAAYTVITGSIAGFSGDVSLSLQGEPPNSNYSFSPNPVSVGISSTLTINTTADTPEGFYQLTLLGTSGNKTHSNQALVQIGTEQKPSLFIASVDGNLSSPSATITVNFEALDPDHGNLVTSNWQYSFDNSTWYDINAEQIDNNNPISSSITSYITWNTIEGTNNLYGVDEETVWFRMKVDNGTDMLQILETYYLNFTYGITGLTHDGSNLWVCDDYKVYKLNTNYISYEQDYSTDQSPMNADDLNGLGWGGDGPFSNKLWTADTYSGSCNGAIYDHDEYYLPPNFRGSLYDPCPPIPSVLFDVYGLTWLDGNLWSTNDRDGGKIHKHHSTDPSQIVETYDSPDSSPLGLTNDGVHLWSSGNSFVYKHESNIETFTAYPSPIYGITGLAWDDHYLWSSNDNNIYKHNVTERYSDFSTFGPFSIDNDLFPIWSVVPDTVVEDGVFYDNIYNLWDFVVDETPDNELIFEIKSVSSSAVGINLDENHYVDLSPLEGWDSYSQITLAVTDDEEQSNLTSFTIFSTYYDSFPPPIITADSAKIDFGMVMVGDTLEAVLTITNSGVGDLHVFEIISTDSHYLANITTMDIPVGENRNLPVYFIPTDFGTVSANLIIRSNAYNDSLLIIPMLGFGQVLPNIVVEFDELYFSTVLVDSSDTLNLLIKSTGNAPLNVWDINNSLIAFSVSDTSEIIGVGDSMSVSVFFQPTLEQEYYDTLRIYNDATIEPVLVALSGTGNASPALQIETTGLIPTEFALLQNYPNPFNPVTTFRYDLPENSFVNISIYDLLGRHVKTLINQTQDVGYKSVIWDATNDNGKPVSAGVYFYQIHAGEFVQTKKIVLLK